MATTFLEPGTDATQDFSFFSLLAGAPTSATDQVYTGSRSIKMGAADGVTSATGVVSDAGGRISFRLRYDTVTDPAGDQFFAVRKNVGNTCFAIRGGAGGTLILNTGQGGTLSTGTKVLSTLTWYRLAVVYTITNSTTFTIKLYVDGVLDQTATNSGTLNFTTTDKVFWGSYGDVNAWYDDLYIDNSNALTDPGNIRVTAKRPFANGTTNGFTTQIGAGGSGYGTGHAPQVNELPLAQADGWAFTTSAAAVTEEYNVENISTGDVSISGTIVDVGGWVFAKSLASETGSIIVNGASSSISLTSTPTLFTKFAGSPTYPAGTGTDIGIVTDAISSTTVSLYECGILVAYTPSTTISASTLLMMGV